MKHAFDKAGFVLSEFELLKLAQGYFQSGGDLETWIRVGRVAAAGMPGEGQVSAVHQDPMICAPARPPIASGEAITALAERPQKEAPPARDPIPDVDQRRRVQQDHGQPVPARNQIASEASAELSARTDRQVPPRNPIASGEANQRMPVGASPSLPPARDPSAEDRSALTRMADYTFLETVKLRGKLLGGYQWGQLKNARAMNLYENIVIAGLLEYRKDKRIEETSLVRNGITEPEFRAIVQHAKSSLHSQVTYA